MRPLVQNPCHQKQFFLKLKKKKEKIHTLPGYWWLTPVILPNWEAKIGRIDIQGQPEQIIQEIPSLK
jgi:hypothetical protein